MAVVVRRDRRPTFLPNGGFVLESAAAVVPDVPEDHLDHAGGGDREQRAEHVEEFDPEEDCDAVEPPTRARLVELEREVRELRAAIAILKTAPVEFPSAFFAAELDSPSPR